jgi:4'-phosphopantetheinyl transferase
MKASTGDIVAAHPLHWKTRDEHFLRVPRRLNPGDVHVWHRATASLEEASLRPDVDLLSAEEKIRHARFMFDRDKRDFTAAHALVRRVLSLYAPIAPGDWTFDSTPNQKPRVAAEQAGDPPLLFSLSHTHGIVACAVSRGLEVGIDVESIDRIVDATGVARRFFAPAEIAMLDACGDETRPTRFVELWTLKEAYVKALGRGLIVPLDQFRFSFDNAGRIHFEAEPGLDAGSGATIRLRSGSSPRAGRRASSR